jgi:hypothetical protein
LRSAFCTGSSWRVKGGIAELAECAEQRRVKGYSAKFLQKRRRMPTPFRINYYHDYENLKNMECVYLLQEIDFNGTPTGLYKIGKTTFIG